MVLQASEQDYEREKLNERIAKLSGGVAVIQVFYWMTSPSVVVFSCSIYLTLDTFVLFPDMVNDLA